MIECDFCGEEFENEKELHIHWMDEHEDELNSHQKDKAKKAKRKQKEHKKDRLRKRKKKAGYGLAAAGGLALLAVISIQVMQMAPSGSTLEGVDFDDRPVLGDEDAPVTIVEFGDYLCPACQSFEHQVKNRLKDEGYFERGEVNFYYLYFPVIDQVTSTNAAVASECVADQSHEEYWNYHDALFDNQRQISYDTEGLVNLAESSTTGLDYDELEQCIDSQENTGIVSNHQSTGRSNHVSATPTVFINGERVGDWSYNDVKQIIDSELE